MSNKFIVSSRSLCHYLDSYIDTIPPGEVCHINVSNGEMKVKNFDLPYSVPAEPQQIELEVIITKRQLSRLKWLCRSIEDQPITIYVTPSQWLDIHCTI